MNSSIYLGFDGGATKTDVIALDSRKEVAAEETGKPANFQIIGIEQTSSNLLEVTRSLLEKLNADFSCVKAMCLALAGAGRKDDAEKLHRGFVTLLEEKKYPVPQIRIESDAVAALEGAFGGEPGMILIGGTGSILFAKDVEGEIHRVGGWGRFIGDEGSGYVLGRSCLAAIAREFDGRGKKTVMTQLLREKTKIGNSESLIKEVYQNNFDISSAATIVIEAAEKTDGVAVGIISENIDELMLHISAMLGKLAEPLPLVLTGGLLSSDNFFSRGFRRKLREKYPEIEIREALFSPVMGAAFLAFKLGELAR